MNMSPSEPPGSASGVVNALTGEEVLTITLEDIKRKLNQDMDFHGHITAPIVEVAWNVVVSVYPREPMTKIYKGDVKSGETPAADEVPVTKDFGSKWTCDSSENAKTPDGVRTDFDLSIPTPEKTSAGVTADVMRKAGRRGE